MRKKQPADETIARWRTKCEALEDQLADKSQALASAQKTAEVLRDEGVRLRKKVTTLEDSLAERIQQETHGYYEWRERYTGLEKILAAVRKKAETAETEFRHALGCIETELNKWKKEASVLKAENVELRQMRGVPQDYGAADRARIDMPGAAVQSARHAQVIQTLAKLIDDVTKL